MFYKVRGTYTENQYGPQFELDRIRAVDNADRKHGFDPGDFYARSRFQSDVMFNELRALAEEHITEPGVRQLVLSLLDEHAELLQRMAAASRPRR